MKCKVEGIISAMVTPMLDDERINKKGIRVLVDRLINAGVHGLFCLGTTGEFYALTRQEKERVIKTVLDEGGGRLPVYVGTGGISTREVIEFTKRIQDWGIAGVSVITPYFITPSQKELYFHYKMIAESVEVPVIMYNFPARTGVHLEVETVARLSEVPNIAGIKDSSGKFENIKGYIENTASDFSVLAGTDSLIYSTLEAGGTGAVAATTNVVPELVVSIYELYKNGEYEKAASAQEKLKPLRAALGMGTIPGVLKAASNIAGIPAGPSRLPVSMFSEESMEELKNIITAHYMDK